MAGAAPNCHIVVVPYPGRGHINPMLNLCRLILNSRPDVLVSFVVTEEWRGLLTGTPTPPPPYFSFATIPNVLPSEIGRGKDFAGFFDATQAKMEAPFEQLLDRLEPPKPSVIIYDTFLGWTVAVANRRNIPAASLFTMSATVFSICHHSDLILQSHDFSNNISDEQGKEQLINNIPGVSSLRIKDLPTIFHSRGQEVLAQSLEALHSASSAQFLLFTGVYELESQVVDALKQKLAPKIYSVGPAIPELNTENPMEKQPEYLKWLDAQAEGSVLYISQGSFLSVSNAEVDEIIEGVGASGVSFLWVARGEADRIRERCGGRGVVVPWCDQLRVLCHPSVGGFWSHCGWNSTKEGAFAGLPMLTFPIFWDQTTNSKMLVDDWKIGLRANTGEESLGTGGQIARLVLRLMDSEREEARERRRRAKQIQQICKNACSEGGSSDKDIQAFISEILG